VAEDNDLEVAGRCVASQLKKMPLQNALELQIHIQTAIPKDS
jgi:hypothetical protein